MTMIVHGCPEDLRFTTLCRQRSDDGEYGVTWAVSSGASAWTCPACLRLYRLLLRVHAAAEHFKDYEDVRDLVDAVAPESRAIDLLTEAEARRVLVVLNKVLAARGAS